MKGQFLIAQHEAPIERDIYADKSALVLEWLLLEGSQKEEFTLREAAIESGASLGLVQRVFEALVREGSLAAVGLRTAKRFHVKKLSDILKSWEVHYNIAKKCRMWTYRSALGGRKELLDMLKHSNFRKATSLALHSAAEMHGCKNTNLQTLELYLLDPQIRIPLEKKLQLEPQERGYEVLLIKPFYKSMLKAEKGEKGLKHSSTLLTFLDLYHFPLRGREQAEFMAQRMPELKRLFKKG